MKKQDVTVSDQKNQVVSKITEIADVKAITKGTSDGQWLDGNSGTNPKRWKR